MAEQEVERLTAEAAERKRLAEEEKARRLAEAAEKRAVALAEWRAAARGKLIIKAIMAKNLPDADKKGGSGCSDPYIKFTVNGDSGPVSCRTTTKHDEKNPLWDTVLVLEVPYEFGLEPESGTVNVSVMDSDEHDDGCNEDDPIGIIDTAVSRDGGKFDQLVDGYGPLNAFTLSFRYEGSFPPEPKELQPK